MTKTKLPLNEINFRLLKDFNSWDKTILESMSKKLPEFKGWIKIRTYIDSKNLKLIKELTPIDFTPTIEFRKALKKDGLIGIKF